MQETLAQRAWFRLCLMLGHLLRTGRYARARIVEHDGLRVVHKHRRFYAPLLISIGNPLMKLLNTGVRILHQREWQEREQLLYQKLYDRSIRVDAGGVLVLPCLAGETLASLLNNLKLGEALRVKAIELAVVALGDFHRHGFTHGDAMAENVLVDLDTGVAHWFDFETVHDARSTAWCRADDLRALLATCLVRTGSEQRAKTVRLIMDVYDDTDVTRLVARSFQSVWQRPLAFHLGQAPLSRADYREIGRLLSERLASDQ